MSNKACVVVVLNKDNSVLLLKRSKTCTAYPDVWCFPGGIAVSNESEKDTAIRETYEETKIILNPEELYGPIAVDYSNGIEVLVFVYFSDQTPVLSNEHTKYKYVKNRLPENIGPMTKRILNTTNSLMSWKWPTDIKVFPDYPGTFGAVRKYDIHTGIDIYTENNAPVYAVEDGIIISVEKFTGPNADYSSPWWNSTLAILIKGNSGVVVYGEVTTHLKANTNVLKGEYIGSTTPVLKTNKNRPMCMLHLELMTHNAKETQLWSKEQSRPSVLLDPTFSLLLHKPSYFNIKE